MRTLFVIAAVVVVVAVGALVVDAQRGGRGRGGDRGRGGRRPGGPPRPRPLNGSMSVNVSTWDREVDGENVTQRGVSVRREGANVSASAVTVFTNPQAVLRNLSLSPGSVLYDLSDAANIVSAVRIGRGRRSTCYLVNGVSGLDFDTVAQELVTRNTTLVTAALAEVQLNATGEEPLTRDESRDLFTSSPSLVRFCRGGRTFNTTAADPATFPTAGAEDEGEKVVAVVGLDAKISILTTLPTPPSLPTPSGRPGRGGRRGGRRG